MTKYTLPQGFHSMITKEQSAQLRKLVKEYTEACIANSWSGSLPIEEKHKIQVSEARTGRELNEFIRTLDGSNQRVGS